MSACSCVEATLWAARATAPPVARPYARRRRADSLGLDLDADSAGSAGLDLAPASCGGANRVSAAVARQRRGKSAGRVRLEAAG